MPETFLTTADTEILASARAEEGYVRLGMVEEVARCLRLEELRAETLVDLIGRRRVA